MTTKKVKSVKVLVAVEVWGPLGGKAPVVYVTKKMAVPVRMGQITSSVLMVVGKQEVTTKKAVTTIVVVEGLVVVAVDLVRVHLMGLLRVVEVDLVRVYMYHNLEVVEVDGVDEKNN